MRQQQENRHDAERRPEQGRSGRAAAVGIHRRINFTSHRPVKHRRHWQQRGEHGEAQRATDRRKGFPCGRGQPRQHAPQHDHRGGQQWPRGAGPIEKQFPAHAAREPRHAAEGERQRPTRERNPRWSERASVVGRRAPREQRTDDRQRTPAVELPVEMQRHPATIRERRQRVARGGAEQREREPSANEIGRDQPAVAVPGDDACERGRSSFVSLVHRPRCERNSSGPMFEVHAAAVSLQECRVQFK